MAGVIVERCLTGIDGFDKISQGGFVRNSNNLILGAAGTGKTTFLLQFLWNGAVKYNENGLYFSFEPDILETLRDGLSFGWDFTKLNEQDKVKFLKFSPKTSIDDLKSELTKLISKYNIKRVCFDPVSVISLNINDEARIREQLFELSSLMKRLNVTSILAEELQEASKSDILKYLTDSVTILHETGISGVSDRALRIVKMRRTSHIRLPVGMKISETGIQVLG